jgi:hypothetical protein
MELAVAKKSVAQSFIEDLQLHIFCDPHHHKKLNPRQQAAMHVFKHELLAAYYRACEEVPAALVTEILDARIGNAFKAQKK